MANSLRSVILQELKSKFPTASWKLGSMLRELVVEPLLYLTSRLSTHLSNAEARLDINTALNNPTDNEATLDLWMSRLGITAPAGRQAAGTIKLMLTDPENMSIPAGTSFYWGDTTLIAAASTEWGEDATPYKQLSPYSYEAEISVTTTGESSIILNSGTPVNWDFAPAVVYDIVVGSPIAGGAATISAQEKANMINEVLHPVGYTGNQCLRRTLRLSYPSIVSDVIARKTNKAKTGSVPLYIKTVAPPGQVDIVGLVEKAADTTTAEVCIPILGVLRVVNCYGPDNELIDNTQYSVTYDEIAGGVRITLQQGLLFAGKNITVRIIRFSGYDSIAGTLQAASETLPCSYSIQTPAVAFVSVSIKAGSEIGLEALTAIGDHINAKPFNGTITGSEIRNILNSYGYTVGNAAVFSVTVYIPWGTSRTFSRTETLTLNAEATGLGSVPVAVYCATDSISVG